MHVCRDVRALDMALEPECAYGTCDTCMAYNLLLILSHVSYVFKYSLALLLTFFLYAELAPEHLLASAGPCRLIKRLVT